MNDIRMAINTLKLANELSGIDKSEIDYMDNSHLYKANLTAIIALEKQIPKKPAETFTDGAFKRPYNICPVCEGYVNRIHHLRSCGHCGQKLDWSVEE